MRVAAETKVATRERIPVITADLLLAHGWENVTTRDITAAAGVANGTLFNYFSSNEAIAASLIGDALDTAQQDFERRHSGDESLDEDLFAFEWTARRHRHRAMHLALKFVSPDTACAPRD